MWGVEAAVIFLTCSVSLIVLFSAPWWIRIFAAVFGHVSKELQEVDQESESKAVNPTEEK